jgi:hypothetical protein
MNEYLWLGWPGISVKKAQEGCEGKDQQRF